MASLKKKLWAVWSNAATMSDPLSAKLNARYVPRAVNGGPSWQVYDKKADRFLSNSEIRALPIEALRDEEIAPQ